MEVSLNYSNFGRIGFPVDTGSCFLFKLKVISPRDMVLSSECVWLGLLWPKLNQ
jgi:hypothetical protein